MANVPEVMSFNELRDRMVRVFVTLSKVNDLNTASAIRSILEAASMNDFKIQGSIIAALNSVDIDRAEQRDLDAIGIASGIRRPQAKTANGVVTVKSLNFDKIFTKVYAGSAAPPAGVTTLNVSDASAFPTSGRVYVGRGSNNLEGPISYNSITAVGNYFQLNLLSPTTKNHNVNESVILAQGGNRVVAAGTVVQTLENSTSESVKYRVLNTVTIPDGEKILNDVPVVCTEVGSKGNVAAAAISQFATNPFPGAGVENLTPFVTGKDTASDPDYRLLIKQYNQNKTKGTDAAIIAGAIGVTSPDDNKTVASASIRKPADRNEPATLFIDDNTVYQPIFQGQGFETVVENANGGEKYLQLQKEDITKALVVSNLATPFSLTGGMNLAVMVGGVLSVHEFGNSDFVTQNSADTAEVINSINANNNLLFSARAVENSKYVSLFAKNYKNEDIEVVTPSTGVNANDFIGFSTNLTYSLRLYKNDILLIKDGQEATLLSIPKDSWPALSTGATLTISLDRQTASSTYTFVDADFVEFGFSTVSTNNSIASWASVFNTKIPGITAVAEGTRLRITSNKGFNSLARIELLGGTLATSIFDVVPNEVFGKTSDYALNRSNGQLELAAPLIAGDNITAGSKNTRAFNSSTSIATGTANIPAVPLPKIWLTIDDPNMQAIETTANASTDITITNTGDIWYFQSNVPQAFALVQVGDWMIAADDALTAINPNFLGYWRITEKIANDTVGFRMSSTLGTPAALVTLTGSKKLRFVRTSADIQELNLPTGIQSLPAIAAFLNNQVVGAFFSVVGGKVLKVTSNTFGLNGSVMIANTTGSADVLGFVAQDTDLSAISHTAFVESSDSEVAMPIFAHDDTLIADSSAPYTSMDTGVDLSLYGATLNDLVVFLNPYAPNSSLDRDGLISSNATLYSQIETFDALGALSIRENTKMNDILAQDRFFLAQAFNFNWQDNLVMIFDRDGVNKSANIRLSRKAQVNGTVSPTTTTFRAYDADFSPTANFANQFGDNFDFADYKIQFKARQIYDPAGPANQFLIQAAEYGVTGENIRFGLEYPQSPNQGLSNSVLINDKTNILVYLASGPQRLGGAWDNTTQFSVSNISPNVWRYNHIGGTPPAFLTASIAVGDVVSVDRSSDFDANNTGSFTIVSVTNTYFDVYNTGGVAEAGPITLNFATDLVFYPLDPALNTANAIGAYITTALPSYITMLQLESGAGVITTSTWADTGSQYQSLVDGENYILSSNIGTTILPVNEFTLKKPLLLAPSTVVGQDFYLIPTRAAQVAIFLNIFAVAAVSSFGNISVSSNAGKLQFYSNLFGTSGAVQVSGGTANETSGAVSINGTGTVKATIEAQDQGAVRVGTQNTFSTQAPHNINVGERFTVSSVKNSTFNAEFTAISTTLNTITANQLSYVNPAISTAVRAANVVTVTTTTNHNLVANDSASIVGVTNASFNGRFTITAILSATQFQYNQLGANAASGSGTVEDYASGDGLISGVYTKFSIAKQSQLGFQAGQWIKVENTSTQQKIIGLQSISQLQIVRNVIGNETVINLQGPGSFQAIKTHSANATSRFKVERQGKFTAISFTGIGVNPNFTFNNIKENDWVVLGSGFNSLNQGTFNIVKVFGSSTIYIENILSVPEEFTLSAASDFVFYSYDSVMPGDSFAINSDILLSANKGTYTVKSVTNSNQIILQGLLAQDFNAGWTEFLLGDADQIQVIEGNPYVAYKKIVNVAQNANNPNLFDIVIPGLYLAEKINSSAGSSIVVSGKMQFPTITQVGEDSYKYYRGLISEVGKVTRGQAEDPTTYPGIEAAGAYIEITSPLPRKVNISIVVKNLTGTPFGTIKSRIQSAVAAYINSLGVGEDIVFSAVVSVVQQLNGVQALAISSPTYDATNLLIPVNVDEKAIVYNVEDVVVSLASS